MSAVTADLPGLSGSSSHANPRTTAAAAAASATEANTVNPFSTLLHHDAHSYWPQPSDEFHPDTPTDVSVDSSGESGTESEGSLDWE